ncbi:thiamine pyrophosphate-binding protein [Simiduia agarivorans]|uniref:Pyruvate decarboxylase/indolepyruvate decarboxylase family protein n=1 Tax=Simiduia agarivorans (strain DSM 21679 / JCM 13881 / BCRC 17597 / SA1) TaxID=1117647 RepID=K4KWA6_SIMAS|nr:thiamine pyrophosphate-binding protein [Simiduia agarivorans]AFU98182.1 pyruvate decarboxylase/indolepyruvate decarboxylase family protein [Simiduia agarivorans SA1 = DSM 21679]
MKLSRLLQNELQRIGVGCLYGIPGDFILPLFEAIQSQNEIPLLYLGHEPSAVFAADAHARMMNKPSAVLLTYGAGALNGVNAVAQAYVEHVPLVVIAGFPARAEIERGLLIHHQAKAVDSQRDIYREITCAQVRLDDPETAGVALRQALDTCVEKSQPVLIEFPRDAVNFDVADLPVPVERQEHSTACQWIAESVWNRIRQAQRPVILAGVDMRRFDAVDALQAFSEKTQIPLLSTLMGRACLDSSGPTYGGIFLDKSDQQPARLLAQADLIVMAGVIKNDSNFAAQSDLFPANKVIDIQQGEPALDNTSFRAPLAQLFKALNALADRCFPLADLRPASLIQSPEDDEPLTSTGVVSELHSVLSQQSSVVPLISDVGDCLFASMQADPKFLLAPAFYASMGYAVPAAFGVQAATGLRPVVLVGDGAFQMTGMELGHCRRYGYSPIILLFNNQRWDMIQAFSPDLSCTALGGWDYSLLAQAMGGQGLVASSTVALRAALQQALGRNDCFTLIDARLCQQSRTARLDRFATGFLAANQKALAC